MSVTLKQIRVSFSEEFFILPSGFFRPIMLPLHFSLENNPFPQLHFSPVENGQWFDQNLAFRLDLQSAINLIIFQFKTVLIHSVQINPYPNILPLNHMFRIVNVLL